MKNVWLICERFPFDLGWTCSDTAVVHIDDGSAVGQTDRCDRLSGDLNGMVPIKNLGEMKWYGGYHYSRDREGYSNDIPTELRGRIS